MYKKEEKTFLNNIHIKLEELSTEIHKAVIGYDDVIENFIVALFSEGHILVEGVPGLAKTLIAKSFADAISSKFSRIQFTPDLMPSDITGTNFFNPKNGEFFFREGPIFANIILADEINRAPPKVQSALLECMQERKVTIEGKTHEVPLPFLVIATQNPVEMEGVYPLPEAQIDRFMFKLIMKYPKRNEEKSMLSKYILTEKQKVNSILTVNDIQHVSTFIKNVVIEPKIFDYILDITEATRNNDKIMLGASPRASLQIATACRARALIKGRSYVLPSDVKTIIPNALRHRIILKPEAQLEGHEIDSLITEILDKTPTPKLV